MIPVNVHHAPCSMRIALACWLFGCPVLTVLAQVSGEVEHFTPAWFFSDPAVIKLVERIKADDLPGMMAAVEGGADIHAVGQEGVTPLMCSTVCFPEGVGYLLQQGAEPNVQPSRATVLGIGGLDMSPIHHAAHKGDVNLLQTLLDYGADPNWPDVYENTALWHVAEASEFPALRPSFDSQTQAIELLLRYGAKFEIPGRPGIGMPGPYRNTPLFQAIRVGDARLGLFMLENGADPTVIPDSIAFDKWGVNTDAFSLLRNPYFAGKQPDVKEQEQYYQQVVKYLTDRGLSAKDFDVPKGRSG